MQRSLSFQVIIFALIRIVFNTIHRMIYPFLGDFGRGLGVNLSTLSLALTGRSIIGGVGPLLATIADSRGRKTGLLLGVIFFITGLCLVVIWPTFLTFFLALVFTTLGKYIFDAAMQAYLSDQIPYQRRGFALAITESGWSLSFILGMPFVAFLIARGNWLTPFQIFAGLGLLILVVILWLIPKDPLPEKRAISFWKNIAAILRYPPALAGFAVGILASTANEVINLIFGIWLSESFGLHLIALGGASAIIGAAEFGGEALVAGLVDKLGKKRAIALGLTLNSLAALALPTLGVTVSGALLGLFFFYITFEFTLVSIIPMMTEIRPSNRAAVMALNISGLSIGRALGAFIAAPLFAQGLYWSAGMAVVFNLGALLALRWVHEAK